MIKSVHVQNFKSLAVVDVRLHRPTVLVGRNASGKSAFIDVLRFLRDALQDGLDKAVTDRHGLEGIRRWAPRKPYDVRLEVELARGSRYGFVLGSGSRGEARVKREWYVAANRWDRPEGPSPSRRLRDRSFELKEGKWIQPDDSVLLPEWAGTAELAGRLLEPRVRVNPATMAFYAIYPNTLRAPQPKTDPRRLADDGRNLASVLDSLDDDVKADIQAALRTAVPDIVGFNVHRIGSYLSICLLHSVDGQEQAIERDVALESDGTLRMLGLATALYYRRTPMLIAIEEPELGIHPGALSVVWTLIQEASDRRGHTVIVTTHSPDLISMVAPDALYVVEREGSVTRIGPLASHQVQAVQEQLFTTGDLLRIQGLHTDVVTAETQQ